MAAGATRGVSMMFQKPVQVYGANDESFAPMSSRLLQPARVAVHTSGSENLLGFAVGTAGAGSRVSSTPTRSVTSAVP